MSTPAGWYDDPERPGSKRWWDGTAWTEHRQPAEAAEPTELAAEELVRVEAGPGVRTGIVATGDRLVIGEETFALAEIDSVLWSAVSGVRDGAYLGVLYVVRVRCGDRKGDFAMDTGHNNVRDDEFAEAYRALVGLLDRVVAPRIAETLMAQLRRGETVTLGPAGARVELTAEGFRLKKPLAKVRSWSDVAGTELEGGRLFFLMRKGGEVKRHSMVPLEGANIVVVPRIVDHLTRAGAGG